MADNCERKRKFEDLHVEETLKEEDLDVLNLEDMTDITELTDITTEEIEDVKIPANIIFINNILQDILKKIFISSPRLQLIISSIKYMIGIQSISYNMRLLRQLCNVHTILPLYTFIDENQIEFQIIFKKKIMNDLFKFNTICLLLKKDIDVDNNDIVSIFPNLWSNTPIIGECIGNVFIINISNDKKNTYILTDIKIKHTLIDHELSFILNQILKININYTLSNLIRNGMFKIKYIFGTLLSNMPFLYVCFNIKNAISVNSTIDENNNIIFDMIVSMKDEKTKITMIKIFLKKYNNIDSINCIKTNIINSTQIENDSNEEDMFELLISNTASDTWILSSIVFIE